MRSCAGSCAVKTAIGSLTFRSERSERIYSDYTIKKRSLIDTNFAITTDKQATLTWVYLVVRERVDFEFLHNNRQWDRNSSNITNPPSEKIEVRSRTQRDHQLLILKSVIRECARHPSKKSRKEHRIHDRVGTEHVLGMS